MKWPNDQYEIVKAAFSEFLENCGHSVAEIRESYKGDPELNVMYGIWRHVQYDITSDDSHPAFAKHGRKRRVSHNPKFVLYPKGCNESHFQTVLRSVGKELELIE